MNAVAQHPLRISSGACEAMKWIALASMLVDHANAVFFSRSLAWAEPLGRIAMPLFAMLVAYNMARPRADLMRMLQKLVMVGALAAPFHTVLVHGHWLPMSVLYTFAVAVFVLWLYENVHAGVAAVVFLTLPALVDYQWTGVALVLAGYAYFKGRAGAWLPLASLGLLCLYNGNVWALLSLPLAHAAMAIDPNVPRIRWLFWAVYPAHLAAFWMLARV